MDGLDASICDGARQLDALRRGLDHGTKANLVPDQGRLGPARPYDRARVPRRMTKVESSRPKAQLAEGMSVEL